MSVDNMFLHFKVVDGASSKLKAVSKGFSDVANKANITGKRFDNAQKSIKKLNNSFTSLSKDANRTATSFKNVSGAFSAMKNVMGFAFLYKLAGGLQTAVSSAIDMTETTNLFNVSLGDMATEADETISKLHELYGMDSTNLQNAVGTYALLARSMGMSTKQSEILSTNMASLAIDLSSLTNVDINQVMADLKSGLVGQSETVYKYGLDVTEAGLKQEAMAQGIAKSVRNMTQGEKMALRYSAMIRQSALAQGDFAKTIETPANQLRILKERFTTLSRSIGSIFIPILGAVLPYLNALVKVLINVANAIARLFGYKPDDVKDTVSSGLGGITDSSDEATDSVNGTTKALEEMKNATLGIDELNVIDTSTPASASGGADASGGGSILGDFEMPSYDMMTGAIETMSDKIQKKLEELFDRFNLFKDVDFQPLLDSLGRLKESAGKLLGEVGEAFTWVFDNILKPLSDFVIEEALPVSIDILSSSLDVITSTIDALKPLGNWLWETFLKPIAKWTGDKLIELLKGMNTELSNLSDWIDEHQKTVETLAIIFGSLAISFGLVNTAIALSNILYPLYLIFMTSGAGVTGALAVATYLLSGAFAILTSPITLVVLAIGAVIAVIILLIRNWDAVISFMKNVLTAYLKTFVNFWVGWGKALFNNFKAIITGIVEIIAGIITFLMYVFTGQWEKIWNTVSLIFKGIWDTMVGICKGAINLILGLVNSAIDGINLLIRGLNKVKKQDIELIPNIPYLETGGIVNSATLAMIGENGKEAVMPLENHTEWIDNLAVQLSEKGGIANNENLVSELSESVALAVSNALSNKSEQPIVLELDGQVIYTNQQKVSQNRGRDFGLGAFAR